MAGLSGRRILVVGVSTPAGGRLAQALERDPAIDLVVGASPQDPACELLRTEFVRIGTQHALLRRLVTGAEIDTVVDTRLAPDRPGAGTREGHEQAVIGTMNLLAACGGAGSPVRRLVLASSAGYYGAARDDPAFFEEDMERRHGPRTATERDVVEAERAAAAFARREPGVATTVVRFADPLGDGSRSNAQSLLGLPFVPAILGFDPRVQFIAQEDVAGVLEHALRHDMPGVVNAAADGVLALSEVASLIGKPFAPLLPPWGTDIAAAALRRLGVRLAPDTVRLLRYGRGLDNRRLKASGYRLRATSREAVLALARHLRVQRLLTDGDGYRYEREVEEFLRRSPSLHGSPAPAPAGEPPAPPI